MICDRQCMQHNVTLGLSRITIAAIESNKYHIVSLWLYSCLSYPACQVHAPYYIVMCGLYGSSMFSTLSLKWQDFWKEVLNVNVYFDFLYNFCLRHFSF
jgi:hypothetical protein